jgi:hypothetical protein
VTFNSREYDILGCKSVKEPRVEVEDDSAGNILEISVPDPDTGV